LNRSKTKAHWDEGIMFLEVARKNGRICGISAVGCKYASIIG